jgi:hypothetical protein
MRKGRITRSVAATPCTRVTHSRSLGCSFFYFLGFSEPVIISWEDILPIIKPDSSKFQCNARVTKRSVSAPVPFRIMADTSGLLSSGTVPIVASTRPRPSSAPVYKTALCSTIAGQVFLILSYQTYRCRIIHLVLWTARTPICLWAVSDPIRLSYLPASLHPGVLICNTILCLHRLN